VITRRNFMRLAALLSSGAASWSLPGLAQEKKPKPEPGTILVNDVHSQLNSARVWRIATPQTLDEVRAQLRAARKEERNVCISGSRHAMGGQQFCADAVMLDIRKLNRVLSFDRERGLLEVESGAQWPQILEYLHESQRGEPAPWAFAQKQSGADRLTIGGCLSANIHGGGLALAPFVQDVESFKLLDAKGGLRNCSRTENPELFSLAIGGYGLFGVIYSATLRLVPRRKLERVADARSADDLAESFATRVNEGFLYGDFRYAIDERSKDFLREGVFVCYRPVPDDTPMLGLQRELGNRDWIDLFHLAHTKKTEAFKRYAGYYLSTSGQLYWSDEHQMNAYPEDYHRVLDKRLQAENRASEAMTEILCERGSLGRFMAEVREYLRRANTGVLFGSVRLVEHDNETFLAWARKPYACVTFNLHVEHSIGGVIRGGDVLRRLIDFGLRHGGGYHPTYNRYALRRQVDACLPQMPEFLKLKLKYDPEEVFQSEWYRHYKRMYFPER
jgi:hypothetical protein